MKHQTAQSPRWEAPFLAALAEGKTISASVEIAGISSGTAYSRRSRNARFAQDWKDAQARPAPRKPPWKKAFIEALAETSNVRASARRAGMDTRTIYAARRTDPAFNAKWLDALREGYDNLEMELLGHLRDPNPARKMDVTAALRLLSAHRDTVERQRAMRGTFDEKATFASLDKFLVDMRRRRAANAAILHKGQGNDGAR